MSKNIFLFFLFLTFLESGIAQTPSTWYLDVDNDGYYVASISAVSSPGLGYNLTATQNGDCDDTDPTVHASYNFYIDDDYDSYGAGNLVSACAIDSNTPPSGFSLNNTDCSPMDGAKWQLINGFVDADGDGYTIGNFSPVCSGTSLPGGYVAVSLGSDCNDAAAMGSVEICGNGIDDDCNGLIDEGCSLSVLGIVHHEVCNLASNGFIDITASGGVSPYSFLWSSGQTTEDIIGLAPGTYTVTATGANNATTSASFDIYPLGASSFPKIPGNINGSNYVCIGEIKTYTVPLDMNIGSYTWTVPPHVTLISGQNTNTIKVQFLVGFNTSNITVRSSNCMGTSTTRVLTVSKSTVPLIPAVISGAVAVCPGTYTYMVPAVANNSYTWTAPALSRVSAGQGTNLITLTVLAGFTTGTLTVRASNCAGTSATRNLNLVTIPGLPGAINGPTNSVCGTTTGLVYSIAPIAGASSYQWIVTGGIIVSGQGTTSITVNFPSVFASASIKVREITSCSLSGAFRALTVTQKPATPGVITGLSSACATAVNTYSIIAVNGATAYNWTAPSGWNIISGAGTAAVDISAGSVAGNITVSASNGCGTSAIRTKALTINAGCRIVNPDDIDEVQEEAMNITELKVYPNPFSNHFTIEFGATNEEKTELKLFDIAGRLVNELSINSTVGINKTNMDIASEAPGIYLLSIYKDNTLKRFRLVKE